jgi:hypothetical protein
MGLCTEAVGTGEASTLAHRITRARLRGAVTGHLDQVRGDRDQGLGVVTTHAQCKLLTRPLTGLVLGVRLPSQHTGVDAPQVNLDFVHGGTAVQNVRQLGRIELGNGNIEPVRVRLQGAVCGYASERVGKQLHATAGEGRDGVCVRVCVGGGVGQTKRPYADTLPFGPNPWPDD